MAVPLNKNNFLRWFGSFNVAPFDVLAVDDALDVTVFHDFVDIAILDNDIATFSIDPTSIVITLQDNIARPATWNPTTKLLRYYLTDESKAGMGDLSRVLKYTWKDVNGNVSNEATVTFTIIPREKAWRVLESSFSCELDEDGHKTGNGIYATLVQYYTDNEVNVVPTNEKDNDPDDPDYIAPAEDPRCDPATYTEIVYHTGTAGSVCSSSDTATAYVPIAETRYAIGTHLFSDTDLTVPVSDGYYRDGDSKLQLVGGVVVNITFCSDSH